MHLRLNRFLAMAFAIGLGACGSDSTAPTVPSAAPSDVREVAPAAPVASFANLPVRISELHYDNVGTDAGEAVEVSYPVGTDISAYSVVLYNGSTPTASVTYSTRTLAGLTPTVCGDRAVVVLSYPANGIQNGSPDGLALVGPDGAVIEFLSYEGAMTASNGPAAGLAAVDIGVSEDGDTPVGFSVQRTPANTWNAPAQNTFGTCNDDGEAPPAVPIATLTVTPATATLAIDATQTLTAAAQDADGNTIPAAGLVWTTSAAPIATVSPTGVVTAVAEGSATITATAPSGVTATSVITVEAAAPPPPVGELPPVRFSELHYDNVSTDVNEALVVEGPAGTDLSGWSIVLYNGSNGLSYNTAPLSGVLANQLNGRGSRVVCYPTDGIQNGSPDGMALVNAAGQVVEFLSYEGTFTAGNGPAAGTISVDIGAFELNAPLGTSLQRNAVGIWSAGQATYTCPSSISFSGRTAFDAPLPVGFEAQVFATLRTSAGVTVPTTFTWTSDTPEIATVDEDGVFRALAAGTAVLRATAPDGTTNTVSLPTRVAVPSTTAQYEGNTEFGEPTDADPSDDFIIRRREFTSSFNRTRNTPNWVSYNLEVTHFGDEDRCDCFTYDPLLPSSFPRYTTADFTGSQDPSGQPYNRGHLTRSFDRTAGSADNAASFYFSNIIPQTADQNQGPWANFENVLGNFARNDNREVYIVAGVAGNAGTVKNEGRIVIPAFTWKVAVILPRNAGLASINSVDDLEVISVVMPNVPGIRNVDWNSYRVTVDSVERLSGYDLLALLPDNIERAVESGSRAPIAVLNGPYSGTEGGSISLSAAGSSDPDSDPITFEWHFGDGTTATGANVTHTYAQDGNYTVQLMVTDAFGLMGTATSTATIANVAPVLNPIAGASLLPYERYVTTGSFVDPGADVWTARVNYGDGSPEASAPVSGRTFGLNHVYAAPGTFTVTVRVNDDDAFGAGTAEVRVSSLAEGAGDAVLLVRDLAKARDLRLPGAVAIGVTLAKAQEFFERDRPRLALPLLRAAQLQVNTLVRVGRVGATEAAPLQKLIQRLIASASH